jgi:hypothetical protein
MSKETWNLLLLDYSMYTNIMPLEREMEAGILKFVYSASSAVSVIERKC